MALSSGAFNKRPFVELRAPSSLFDDLVIRLAVHCGATGRTIATLAG